MSTRTSSRKVEAIKPKNMKTKSPQAKKIATKVTEAETCAPTPLLAEEFEKKYLAKDLGDDVAARLQQLISNDNDLYSFCNQETSASQADIERLYSVAMNFILADMCTVQAQGKLLHDVCKSLLEKFQHLKDDPLPWAKGYVRNTSDKAWIASIVSQEVEAGVDFLPQFIVRCKSLLRQACVLEKKGIKVSNAISAVL